MHPALLWGNGFNIYIFTIKVLLMMHTVETKGQIISEANYLFLNSSKKRTKNFCLCSMGKILEKFHSFLICF